MSDINWAELMNLAQNQGVLGFAFDGLEIIDPIIKIEKQSSWFFEAYCGTLQRESYNRKQIQTIEELCSLWKKHGIQMLLLKGQANGLNYPRPSHRDCGDIDCYLFGQYDKGNQIIQNQGITVNEDWEKHSKFLYKGETIENHQFFVQTLDSSWWKALHEDFVSLIKADLQKYPVSEVFVPSVLFNALFLTYHAMEHFTMGNLRLKQILDWAMFVKSNENKIDWLQIHTICEKYGMDDFLNIMNRIISTKLKIKVDSSNDESDVDSMMCKVLHSVFYDDDYIWLDANQSRWAGRIHYLVFVIKNRWKFNIAGRSSFKQLWLYITTYAERNFKQIYNEKL